MIIHDFGKKEDKKFRSYEILNFIASNLQIITE